ncbi:hypothetical protein SAMN05216480_101912 [Pustulibacterium marinum]|uniref:Uncharacterized protein n=1 Tax=Pustulibacterium marinum TaxID=1224947 RepID=A0A1I7FEQ9_9FLAO|nr:hypothetical protein [Pustulibacterium marinum]SFU34595.1 hypothetical protein SAMN05216480_101912 [Pustulibacterium marinum]
MYRILVFFVAILFTACSSSTKKKLVVTDYISNNADYVVKVNDVTALLGELRNNELLKNTELSGCIPVLKNFEFAGSYTPIYLVKEQDDFTILWTFPNQIEADSTNVIDLTTFQTEEVKTLSLKNTDWFAATQNNIFLCASTKNKVQSLLNTINENTTIKKFISIVNNDVSANLLVKKDSENTLFQLFNSQLGNENWKVFDIKSNSKEVLLSGVAQNEEKIKFDILKNSTPAISRTPTVTSDNFSYVKSYIFSSFTYSESLPKVDSVFAGSIEEIGFIKKDTTTVAAVFATIPENTLEYCVTNNVATYRDKEIFSVSDSEGISSFFQVFEKDFKPKFVSLLDDALLFSEDQSTLEQEINAVLNGKTLENSADFKKAKNRLPEASSIFSITNLEQKKISEDLKNYSFAIEQIVVDASFMHINLLALENDAPKYLDEIGELNSIKLENPITSNPKLVTNYITKELEIAVQDAKNQLYLLNLDGSILWKKQLDSPIQGTIEQIDIHGNGRLQFAFTTEHNFYIINREGKNIRDFPIHFNDKISNPTGIFDYDLNHKYRFLITQKNRLYMLDKTGKSVNGFKLKKTLGSIISTPKHIRVGKKDYIVFKTDDQRMHIINRVGETRVSVSEKIDFSENDIYWYNNHFTTTNTDGNLVMVSQNGQTTETSLPLSTDHKITATTQTLVTLSENNLTIKGHNITLDFGIYTEPKIYYLHQKIYVAVTDKQTNRLFVLDSNGEMINGFPVFAKGMADMNINTKTEAVYLTAKSGGNELVVYKLPPLF